jgi:hypothetical protein
MHSDFRGVTVKPASPEAVLTLYLAIEARLSCRSDIMPQMQSLFAADPNCGSLEDDCRLLIVKVSRRQPV